MDSFRVCINPMFFLPCHSIWPCYPWPVSPPAEHVSGDAWWTDYQPVSYTINSKRGNRDQFSRCATIRQLLMSSNHNQIIYLHRSLNNNSMVTTCHNAGVKVIAGTSVSPPFLYFYITPDVHADTLFNHMSGSDSGTGVGGSNFTHYDYPGIYQTQVRTTYHYDSGVFFCLISLNNILYPGFPSLWPRNRRWYRGLY
jgi:hypothetical protein